MRPQIVSPELVILRLFSPSPLPPMMLSPSAMASTNKAGAVERGEEAGRQLSTSSAEEALLHHNAAREDEEETEEGMVIVAGGKDQGVEASKAALASPAPAAASAPVRKKAASESLSSSVGAIFKSALHNYFDAFAEFFLEPEDPVAHAR